MLMVETASYEVMLHKLKGKEEDGVSSWELFRKLYKANQRLTLFNTLFILFLDQVSWFFLYHSV